jgi:hypothetical protein
MKIYFDVKYNDNVIATKDKFIFLHEKLKHKILYSKESILRLVEKTNE